MLQTLLQNDYRVKCFESPDVINGSINFYKGPHYFFLKPIKFYFLIEKENNISSSCKMLCKVILSTHSLFIVN